MKRWLFFLTVSCSLFLTQAIAGQKQDLKLQVLLDERRPLVQDCFGANCLLLNRPVWYDHPAFVKRYEESNAPFFRFPGGTPANYYNPETGTMDNVKESNRTFSPNYDALKPDKFFEFAQKTGARYSVVLNVCTRTVEQNRTWLLEVAKKGHRIPCFEIGNEVYFGIYSWAFPKPQDYLQRAKKTTAMIRNIFPDAKVGVVVPSHLYTTELFLDEDQPIRMERQQQWLEMLEGHTFFDAVVVHLYSRTGMDGDVKQKDFLPFTESYQNAVAHLDDRLDTTLDTLEKKFPAKSIWITEYGVGGFTGQLRRYRLRYSHLGALHSDIMLLRFLARPSVAVSSWHSFSQFFDYVGADEGIGEKEYPPYLHFSLFSVAVRNSRDYVPLKIDGGGHYLGTHENPANYSDVEAGAFVNRNSGYVIVINKLGNSYTLQDFSVLEKSTKRRASLIRGLQLTHRRNIAIENAASDNRQIKKIVLFGTDMNSITLKPYSVTRIEFVWQ